MPRPLCAPPKRSLFSRRSRRVAAVFGAALVASSAASAPAALAAGASVAFASTCAVPADVSVGSDPVVTVVMSPAPTALRAGQATSTNVNVTTTITSLNYVIYTANAITANVTARGTTGAGVAGSLSVSQTLTNLQDAYSDKVFTGPAAFKLAALPATPTTGTFQFQTMEVHLVLRDVDGVVVRRPQIPDTDGNLDTVDLPCTPKADGAGVFSFSVTNGSPGDVVPPTIPINVSSNGAYPAPTISWSPSVDDTGVASYDVLLDGKLATTTKTTSAAINVGDEEDHQISVRARDAAGNVSDASAVLLTHSCVAGPSHTRPPTGVTASGVNDFSATISWTQPPFGGCFVYTEYYVITYAPTDGSTPAQTVTVPAYATTFQLTALNAGKTYRATVTAFNASAGTKSVSAPVTFTTTGVGDAAQVRYKTTGAMTLKTATAGRVPFTGTMFGTVTPSGAFSATATFGQMNPTITAAYFFVIKPTIVVTPTGPITGQLKNGVLTATLTAQISIPFIKQGGLDGGSITNPTCRVSRPTTFKLTSTGKFDPAVGGTLAGTFTWGNLTACGNLTSFLSTVWAGGGNAMVIQLAPIA